MITPDVPVPSVAELRKLFSEILDVLHKRKTASDRLWLASSLHLIAASLKAGDDAMKDLAEVFGRFSLAILEILARTPGEKMQASVYADLFAEHFK